MYYFKIALLSSRTFNVPVIGTLENFSPCKFIQQFTLSAQILRILPLVYRFGVNEVSIQEKLLMVNLCYTPKKQTLINKFGDLPVKYMKMQVKSEKDLNLLREAASKYRFDFDGDLEQPEGIEGRFLQPIEENPIPQQQRKNKRAAAPQMMPLRDQKKKPKTQPLMMVASTSKTNNDDDVGKILRISSDDEDFRFESQMF